jgi:anti-anti-sigma factor
MPEQTSLSNKQDTSDKKEGANPMLSFTTQNLGDVTVFRCAGRITADSGNQLQNEVVNRTDAREVVLDLAEVSAVDAAGLGVLVSLRTWAETTGRRLKLMNLLPRVEKVLELTHLRSAFDVCSLREMLDLLCRASHLGPEPVCRGVATPDALRHHPAF